MNEMESDFSVSQVESEDNTIDDYLKRIDAQWCLRRLALVATKRLDGDPEDAVEKIYQSAGSLNATEASCFTSDCHVRTSISKLAEGIPQNCTMYLEVHSSDDGDLPKALER